MKRLTLALVAAISMAIIGPWSSTVQAANAPANCGQTVNSFGHAWWVGPTGGPIASEDLVWAAFDNGNGTCAIYVSVNMETMGPSWSNNIGVDWHGWLSTGIYVTSPATVFGAWTTANGRYFMDSGATAFPGCLPGNLHAGWNGNFGCNPFMGVPYINDYCKAGDVHNPNVGWCGYMIGFTLPYGQGWGLNDSGSLLQGYGYGVTAALADSLW